jgi:threonine dehydratase
MPEFAPLTKREATEGYGAEVILHGATYDEACAHAMRLCDGAGATFVHAFDDELVMAGQGTIGLEILSELPTVSMVVCPVGGGGLIAGVATAIKAVRPDVRVVGVQAKGADSAVASFRTGWRVASGHVETIADGIKVAHVGERTFEIIRERVDDMVTVDDEQICNAMLMLDEHAHISAEPAGSVPLAAFLSGALPPPQGDVVAIVSGGNIDTFEKTRYVRRALAGQHRHHRVRVRLADRRGSKPREMARLFGLIADHEMNVLAVSYRRDTPSVPLGVVEVELLVEARGAAHACALDEALARAGFASEAEAPARPAPTPRR